MGRDGQREGASEEIEGEKTVRPGAPRALGRGRKRPPPPTTPGREDRLGADGKDASTLALLSGLRPAAETTRGAVTHLLKESAKEEQGTQERKKRAEKPTLKPKLEKQTCMRTRACCGTPYHFGGAQLWCISTCRLFVSHCRMGTHSNANSMPLQTHSLQRNSPLTFFRVFSIHQPLPLHPLPLFFFSFFPCLSRVVAFQTGGGRGGPGAGSVHM